MLTLHLTVNGQPLNASRHETYEDLGNALAKAFKDADIDLTPRAVATMVLLMCSDLAERQTWGWDSEDYQISVTRDGPQPAQPA